MSISNMNSLGQALPAAGGGAGSPSRRAFNVGNSRPRSLQLDPIYPSTWSESGPATASLEKALSLDIPSELDQLSLKMDWIGQVPTAN
jgi:hypothetical protein